MVYTVSIFDAAQSSIDPYLAAIIFGLMQMIGTSLSTVVIERIGRRPLLFASTLGLAAGHIVLGILFLIQSLSYDISSIGWLPIVAICSLAIAASVGLGPLCFTVSNEVYHPDAASFCGALTLFMFSLASFVTAKFYPIIGDSIGLHYCFFLMASLCICTFLLIFFLIPETKGRTRESILTELRLGRKIKLGDSP
uniref:Major facilitator superfamily (MFS) profile domain-containing protein n=1 Tax=Bracon brevicornis TaxID=1563983 RepID=A0A6V7IX18_9HYME